MMELSAIRGRMKEGIAANARHDALQPRLLTSADDVLVRGRAFYIVLGNMSDLGDRGCEEIEPEFTVKFSLCADFGSVNDLEI